MTTQDNLIKSLLERYGKTSCNSTYTPDVGTELSLYQPGKKVLNEEDKQHFQALTGPVLYLGHMARYGTPYAINQLASAMSKLSKAHMAAAKHLLFCLPGTTDSVIDYKQRGIKPRGLSDVNWGISPDNGKSMYFYIVMCLDFLVSFKMEANLVAATLAM